mgnify:CR=1 FL=1
MTYSVDLRERVVEFVKQGGSKSEAARRFKVSRWCVYDWLCREDLTPNKQGCPGPWKLFPESLQAHVEAFPDASKWTVMFWQMATGGMFSSTVTAAMQVLLFPLASVTVRRTE